MKFGKWKPVLILFLTLSAVFIILDLMPNNNTSNNISLITSDNVKIAAKLYKSESEKGWLILTHMMPATKESWNEFAKEMQNFGYTSLAIDLRGHGESAGGPNGYNQFSDTEHQASINDLKAAWEYLKSNGANPERTYLIGASIGANLSLQFLTEHSEFAGGILLSSGNYKEIDSGLLVKKLSKNQKIVFVASRQDEQPAGNNAEQNQQYYNSASQVKVRHLILFDGAGHGTDLFALKKEFNLVEAIKRFLDSGNIN